MINSKKNIISPRNPSTVDYLGELFSLCSFFYKKRRLPRCFRDSPLISYYQVQNYSATTSKGISTETSLCNLAMAT